MILHFSGDKWKNRRKILTPTFHLNILHEYCKGSVENANQLVSSLKTEATSDSVTKELLSMCTGYTLYSICGA